MCLGSLVVDGSKCTGFRFTVRVQLRQRVHRYRAQRIDPGGFERWPDRVQSEWSAADKAIPTNEERQ